MDGRPMNEIPIPVTLEDAPFAAQKRRETRGCGGVRRCSKENDDDADDTIPSTAMSSRLLDGGTVVRPYCRRPPLPRRPRTQRGPSPSRFLPLSHSRSTSSQSRCFRRCTPHLRNLSRDPKSTAQRRFEESQMPLSLHPPLRRRKVPPSPSALAPECRPPATHADDESGARRTHGLRHNEACGRPSETGRLDRALLCSVTRPGSKRIAVDATTL